MPKASSKESHKLIRVQHADPAKSKRPVLVRVPLTYKDALGLIRTKFHIRDGYEISLQTNTLDDCEGEMVDVDEDVWDIIRAKPEFTKLFFEETKAADALDAGTQAPVEDVGRISLSVSPTFGDGRSLHLRPHRWTKVSRIWAIVAERTGRCEDDFGLIYGGMRMVPSDTLEKAGVQDGGTIDAYLRLIGGKPVIYLSSHPACRQMVPITRKPSERLHETVEWDVETRADGSLVQTDTGLEIAYLFWEATTTPAAGPSPPPSPRLSSATGSLSVDFVPNQAELTPQNSVVLSIDDVPTYLDKSLKALTLHTEARTSFITYWLPNLLKHKHVALRFLPQRSYEAAAPLTVTPSPDVVTRVFMLFTGVDQEELGAWDEAVGRANLDVSSWVGAVGVDVEKSLDAGLFRVLEWGGMEVL